VDQNWEHPLLLHLWNCRTLPKKKRLSPRFSSSQWLPNERDNNTHVSILVHASGHGLAIVDGFGFSRLTLDTLIAQPGGTLWSLYIRAK
jgi:hypothetical protein